MKLYSTILIAGLGAYLSACAPAKEPATQGPPQPKEIIDLGALVTEDLPERFWGRRYLADRGWTEQNTVDVRVWNAGPLNGSNAFYTLFNHGGPHVDAPRHMGMGPGIDSYPAESFAGPLKVFDVSERPPGRTVPVETFQEASISPGSVVIIYTNFELPRSDTDYPRFPALTREAAEYLASIPVRAFGTDGWSVDPGPWDRPAQPATGVSEMVPVHHAFLSRGIPAYEALSNVDKLLGKQNLYFVGQPLNIQDGDGMLVRPLVLVY